MSIKYKILGDPGKDNSLMVWIDSGSKFYRMLFDCGEDVLKDLDQKDIRSINYIFFSHLHIDHAAGFDYFFRRNYERENKPIYIFGPEYTSDKIYNKLNGYTWNLLWEPGSVWFVSDILSNSVNTYRFNSSEGFSKKNEIKLNTGDHVLDTPDFIITSVLLNHKIPSAGYKIQEKEVLNIDKAELEELNLPGGPWIEEIKNQDTDPEKELKAGEKLYKAGHLKEKLLKKTRGNSIAYLTDFLYHDSSTEKAVKMVTGTDILVCEAQYSENDKELAEKNFHLSSVQAARLAADAGVKKLILIHVSARYTAAEDLRKILSEARNVFPESYFPENWLPVTGYR